MLTISGTTTSAQVLANDIDATTFAQIQSMVNHESFADAKIRIMPDTHAGKGSVVGFTMPLNLNRVIPNVIGVDIGCGIDAHYIPRKYVEGKSFTDLHSFILNNIPSGMNIHTKRHADSGADEQSIEKVCTKLGLDYDRAMRSIGTLGGGNHFIELAVSSYGVYWLLIHSGSRNFGLQVCNYHQRKAVLQNPSVNPDFAFLSGADAEEYIEDMYVAQGFAADNRDMMASAIMNGFFRAYGHGNAVYTTHNYINPNDRIIRKGAIQANEGQMLVIPLNMRDGTLLCRGKGNAEWNNSAPHGAGRLMGRNQAKKVLSLDEFKRSMDGVYSECVDAARLDEAPMAYKSGDMIREMIEPVAEVVDVLKPVFNFKA